jgi:hypothetical protein
MHQARSISDKTLDDLSRACFYDGLKKAKIALDESAPDAETLHTIAYALEAAACGFDHAEDYEERPPELRRASQYNDDLLNEKARIIYHAAMTRVQAYLQSTANMNLDRIQALARLADACGNAFHEEESYE